MILVLGGTREARQLADHLYNNGKDVIESLAGATQALESRNHVVRTGGFGGVSGLVYYIRRENVSCIIDATHPYASQIGWNAAKAATETNIPIIRYERPAWVKPYDGVWFSVPSIEESAQALPKDARVFLSVGGQSLAPFAACQDVWFLYRSIDPAKISLAGYELNERPPFTVEHETSLMEQYKISHLVTKNSGGSATYSKIIAATNLKIPIIVIERPVRPVLEIASTSDQVFDWIKKFS